MKQKARKKHRPRPPPKDWERLKKAAWAGAKSYAIRGALSLLQ